MRTDEGGIGDELAVILDERNLALRRTHRHARVLFVSEPRHIQLHLGLGDIGADLGKAEIGAAAMERAHSVLLMLHATVLRPGCCHPPVSSSMKKGRACAKPPHCSRSSQK